MSPSTSLCEPRSSYVTSTESVIETHFCLVVPGDPRPPCSAVGRSTLSSIASLLRLEKSVATKPSERDVSSCVIPLLHEMLLLDVCHGLTPWVGSWAPQSCCFPPPHSRMGARIEGAKVRKPVGWDKSSLIGKEKAVCTSKEKEGIPSLLPIGRQMFGHFQESKAHHT